jgi:hypothetical protein
MATFLIFLGAVAVYMAFVLWCLTPLFRVPRWLPWPRLTVGFMLLGANVFPPLAWPFTWPAYASSEEAGYRLTAIILFPLTLPIYLTNVHRRSNATATIVEIKYPIAINGTRYAPVVRTVCTERGMISIDFGAEIKGFANYPTASGEDFFARTNDAVLAVAQSNQLCSMVQHGRVTPGVIPAPTWVGFPLTVYVVRGEAHQTQVYELAYGGGTLARDDIVLEPPEIVRLDDAPARDVVSLDALWPMDRRGEMRRSIPVMIEAYQRLPAGINDCVFYVPGPKTSRNIPAIIHVGPPQARRIVLATELPTFCRDELRKRIPATTTIPLAPVTN